MKRLGFFIIIVAGLIVNNGKTAAQNIYELRKLTDIHSAEFRKALAAWYDK